MINTLLGMAIDPDTMRPVLGGRHRRPVRPGHPAGRGALRLAGARGAARTCRSSAMGGVRTGLDALELHPRRRLGGRGGHGDLPRPVGALARAARTGRGAGGPRGRPAADAVGQAHGSTAGSGTARPTPARRGRCKRSTHDVQASTIEPDSANGGVLAVSKPAPIAVALDAPDLETAARWAALVTPARAAPSRSGSSSTCATGRRRSPRSRGASGVSGVPRPEAARHPGHRRRRRAERSPGSRPAYLTVHAAGGAAWSAPPSRRRRAR